MVFLFFRFLWFRGIDIGNLIVNIFFLYRKKLFIKFLIYYFKSDDYFNFYKYKND